MYRFDPGSGCVFHIFFSLIFFSPNPYESIGSGIFKRVKASKDGTFQINVFHISVNYYYPSVLISARVGSMMERLFLCIIFFAAMPFALYRHYTQ